MKIRKNELILLSGGGRKYLTSCAGKFSCKFGSVNLDLFVGKKFGIKIKIGKEKFSAIKPNVLDILRFAKRGPQVILSKDSSAIASVTGCGKGWKVLDAGSGSGFNAIFLANLGCEVLTAEKDKRFFRLAERNILTSNSISPLKIQIKNSPVEKLFRKEHFDLITLDLQNSQKLVRKSFSALKPGGWLAVYALQSEDLPRISSEIKKVFGNSKISEFLQRDWQFEKFGDKTFTRPKTWMMGHTGFLIFSRKQ